MTDSLGQSPSSRSRQTSLQPTSAKKQKVVLSSSTLPARQVRLYIINSLASPAFRNCAKRPFMLPGVRLFHANQGADASWSSGHPKAIAWSHEFLLAISAANGRDRAKCNDDVLYTCFPMFHVRPAVRLTIKHVLTWASLDRLVESARYACHASLSLSSTH